MALGEYTLQVRLHGVGLHAQREGDLSRVQAPRRGGGHAGFGQRQVEELLQQFGVGVDVLRVAKHHADVAQADGGRPAARQIDAWFWHGTVAGRLLVALRSQALNSDDKAFKTAGGRFLVPAPWVPQ